MNRAVHESLAVERASREALEGAADLAREDGARALADVMLKYEREALRADGAEAAKISLETTLLEHRNMSRQRFSEMEDACSQRVADAEREMIAQQRSLNEERLAWSSQKSQLEIELVCSVRTHFI